MVTTTGSLPIGATAFTPPGPAPPETRSYRSFAAAELALHRAPPQQIAGHRQHADTAVYFAKPRPAPHLLFRIGVTVVQGEGQRRRAGVRRDRDDHALCRIAAGEHEAEVGARADAGAEQLGALDLRPARSWGQLPVPAWPKSPACEEPAGVVWWTGDPSVPRTAPRTTSGGPRRACCSIASAPRFFRRCYFVKTLDCEPAETPPRPTADTTA